MVSAPQRSCAVCRTKLPQAQLQRWIIIKGEAQKSEHHEGRGYYSCTKCLDKAQQVITAKAERRRNNG